MPFFSATRPITADTAPLSIPGRWSYRRRPDLTLHDRDSSDQVWLLFEQCIDVTQCIAC